MDKWFSTLEVQECSWQTHTHLFDQQAGVGSPSYALKSPRARYLRRRRLRGPSPEPSTDAFITKKQKENRPKTAFEVGPRLAERPGDDPPSTLSLADPEHRPVLVFALVHYPAQDGRFVAQLGV
jgi:hypothetical protein